MPAFQFDFVNSSGGITKNIESTKTKQKSVDSRLHGVTNKILLTELQFKESSKTPKMQFNNLKSRYTTFNYQNSSNHQNNSNHQKTVVSPKGDSSTNNAVALAEDGIPLPRHVLFDPNGIDMGPMKINHIGPGLNNQGNTCFVNAVLQCLTYCSPLFNYLASDDHTRKCTVIGFCPLCELKRHMKRIIDHRGYNGAITPQSILVKLKVIAKHMCWGRQEDAHEFLRFITDAMQKACLQGKKNLDKYSKETTVVNQVFGGYLRSQVMCLRCRSTSSTYEPFMDLSVDIKSAATVEQALGQFVSSEALEGDNAYHCTKCRSKQSAKKNFTVHRVPNVLTLHLKRFGYSGNKLHKHVRFQEVVNLRPYMSDIQGAPIRYRLFGITCHEGMSSNCGHYTAFIKTYDRRWHYFNDSRISTVSTSHLLGCQAYILFYVRESSQSNKGFVQKQSPSFNSLKSPPKPSTVMSNGLGKMDIGTAVKRPQENFQDEKSKLVNGSKLSGQPSPKMIPVPPKVKPKSYQPLPENHSKISFGLHPKKSEVQDNDTTVNKPRLVMKIDTKKGKCSYEDLRRRSLVPYDGESSESENDSSNTDKKDLFKGKKEPSESKSSPSKKRAVEFGIVHKKEMPSPSVVPGASLTDIMPGSAVPLNKTVNNDPSCVTPIKDLTLIMSPTKVNSTTPKWLVQHHDALVSPSVASETSIASNSSTSQWHVEDKKIAPKFPILPEGQHAGWKVEGGRIIPSKPATESNKTVAPNLVNGVVESASADSSRNQSPVSDDPTVDISDTQPLLDQSGERTKHKKHKKRKHGHPDMDDDIRSSKYLKYRNEDDDERSARSESLHSSKKERKDKHRHKSKSKFYVENGQDRLNGSANDEYSSKASSSDSKKYNDSHRSSDQSDESEHRRTKYECDRFTKKLQKHRHDDDRHSPSKRKLDEERPTPSKHKSRHHDDGDGHHSRRSKEHHDKKQFDVEWVEVTKKSPEVESKFWDSQVKDGFKRARPEVPEGKHANWDGRKLSDVAAQLEKMSSSHGYGESVKSWDGERSHLDKEVDKEKSHPSDRNWEDDYEEELDMGRTKKYKTGGKEARHKPEGNPFQSYQEERNWSKAQLKNTYSTSIHKHQSHNRNGHSYHEHDHHHSNHERSHHRHSSGDSRRHSHKGHKDRRAY